MNDIRLYLQKGKRGFTADKITTSNQKIIQLEDSEPIDKMKNIRDKMTASRKKKESQEILDAMVIKRRKTLPKTWKGERLIHACEVENDKVQEEPDLVVVGSDVEALYPSLTDVEVGLIRFKAVMESKVEFQNINYRKATQYIAMCLSKEEQMLSPLKRILPRRTSKGGVRPGVTANTDNEENWIFPVNEEQMTTMEKRMIIATVIQIGVVTMMNTHVYDFDGEIFLQKTGGPIGLRSTCAVARITMSYWDARWLDLMEKNNVRIRKSECYMDDVRAFLMSLKMGWRWMDGGLCFTESWRLEDEMTRMTSTRRTGQVLVQSMNEVLSFLRFTLEIGHDLRMASSLAWIQLSGWSG